MNRQPELIGNKVDSNGAHVADSLKARAIRAGYISIAGKLAAQAVRLASNLVMTRLLAPDMFGVMAVGLVLLQAVQMFSDIGLRQIVIKSGRGNDPDFLNTVWTVQVVRGCALTIVCLAIAGIVWILSLAGVLPSGSTYAHPMLGPVLAALSLSAAIAGFDTTNRLSANRDLALGRVVGIELGAQALAFVPMALWAYWNPSVFALVAGALGSTLLQVLLGHWLLPGQTNRFAWEQATLVEVRGFGRWILVTSSMGVLMRLGDRVVLSALLGPPTMGLYAIACIMAGVPQHLAEQLIYTVGLPVLSEVQRTDPDRLRSIYYRIRLPVDALCLGSGAAIFTCADTIIRVLYDDRYSDAGWMLQSLAITLFSTRFAVVNQFYLVLDRAKLTAQLQMVRLICLFSFIPAGYFIGGIQGAIWAVALAPMPEVLISVFWVQRKLKIVDYRREVLHLTIILPGLLSGWLVNWVVNWLSLAV